MLDSTHLLLPTGFPSLIRQRVKRVQANLGYRCNLSCKHCHVDAGPSRTESMTQETMDQLLSFMSAQGLEELDLTGGAPELNPNFRYLVERARNQAIRVTDRCNLIILEEPEQEGLAEFLAAHQVEIVASLPCYLEQNVDAQRGGGTYGASIKAIQRLNALGYGQPDTGLVLSLVYNPAGPTLPPPQQQLEADYRRELSERYGIRFTQLFTLVNMPIRRFGSLLQSKGIFEAYLGLLREAFVASNLDALMCRYQISVDWRGYLYDCDFNQMLDMPLLFGGHGPVHLGDLMVLDLEGNPIRVAEHCYGCAAGQGSSCGGALSK